MQESPLQWGFRVETQFQTNKSWGFLAKGGCCFRCF